MLVKISKANIDGKIVVPASKSFAHRALIAAFLANAPLELEGNFNVGDIQTTIECLKNLGLECKTTTKGLKILKSNFKHNAEIDVKDSGSTFRFLFPVCCALGLETSFVGTERLANRPISELVEVLKRFGAEFSSLKLPLKISNKLRGGDYTIDGNVSSQYITGLLLALPTLKEKSKIQVNGEIVSKNYIQITLDILQKFGVKIEQTGNEFYISENSSFVAPKKMIVESDFSSACFFAVLGALAGSITISGLDFNSSQGDKIIVDILKRVGAEVEISNDELTVKKSKLYAIDFDAENTPDVVPILAVLAAFCEGTTIIRHIERLRAKESDRVFEVLRLLSKMGITAKEEDNCLIIEGGKPHSFDYVAPDDHRMAMSAAVAASAISGTSTIDNAECVKKSYPQFFDDLQKVGGLKNA